MRKHIIFDDMTQCTETDVERLKALASKQRLEQAMRYKHLFGQWACLKSYEMLLQLLYSSQTTESVYVPHDKNTDFLCHSDSKPIEVGNDRHDKTTDFVCHQDGKPIEGENNRHDKNTDFVCSPDGKPIEYGNNRYSRPIGLEDNRQGRPIGLEDNRQGKLIESAGIRYGKEIEFEYNEYGKPRLTEEWAERMQTPFRFFSISHCKEGIAVAVSEHETGIDIESRTRRISDGLAERVMNEQEQHHIATHPDPQTAFIELWTKKEAVLKLRGTGIIDDMRDVLTGNEHIETHVYDTYIVSIASV